MLLFINIMLIINLRWLFSLIQTRFTLGGVLVSPKVLEVVKGDADLHLSFSQMGFSI